jgi:hypothetical protein
MKRSTRFLITLAIGCAAVATLRADEVTDWNQIFPQANIAAGTNPLFSSRLAAMVQVHRRLLRYAGRNAFLF